MPTGPEQPAPDAAQDQEIVIGLENVSIRYRVPRERLSGIKEYTIRWLQRRLEYDDFWALTGITAYVRRGEIFGVIGRNGSGKSTLLKTIAHVLYPTRGRLFTRGRVAPLLELGAGFQPELTGRENIFLNSALLGRTHQQTLDLLPEILDFAEVSEFIDAPLRTYSTGMVARLGFSVATCLRPEILLVDEVLSVGDSRFQQKCLDRMYGFVRDGTTVVIVSHGMATIEAFCQRALWLDKGHLNALGPVAEVIQEYANIDHSSSGAKPVLSAQASATQVKYNQVIERHQDYVVLNEIGGVYPAEDVLDFNQGTFTSWMRFDSEEPGEDAVLFHTDDSRYVLYIAPVHSFTEQKTVRQIVARAGGNRRVLDTFYGTSDFPEVSALLEQSDAPGRAWLPAGEWHLVSMTWSGYPTGKVCLFLDDKWIGEKEYDPRSNRGDPLASGISIGMRPSNWLGEWVQNEDGVSVDSRPQSLMAIGEAGIEMKDIRLYSRALSTAEICQLARNIPLSNPPD